MKIKELQIGIIDQLLPFLKEFKFRKAKNSFFKFENDFKYSIFYSWVIGDKEYPVSFSFRIGSRIVNKIQQTVFDRPIDDNDAAVLVARTQSMVFNMKPKEFHINTSDDIVQMCDAVKNYLNTKGFAFFKEYQNYEKILKEMKSTPPGLYYGQGFITWSLNALTLSKLLDDPEYDMLAFDYINYSETNLAGTEFLIRLKELDNFLKTKSSNELRSM